jgi:E3 ubiquitin-protein ligase DOA10
VHGGLLMTYQNVLEFVLPEDGIINFQNRAAGVAEQKFDPFFLQATDQDFRARYLHLVPLCLVLQSILAIDLCFIPL